MPPTFEDGRPTTIQLAPDPESYKLLLAPLGHTELLNPAVYDPRATLLGYWLYVAGAIMLIWGFLTPEGASDGWWGYTPLSNSIYTPGPGQSLWAAGFFLAGAGMVLQGGATLWTIVRLRGQASQLEFAQRQLDAEQSKNRREMTLTVTKLSAVGEQTRTALEALRENGIHIETSCEQGVCGTCLTGLLEGLPDHRDVFLTDDEKEAGDKIMPCVSRAKSSLLVLDL